MARPMPLAAPVTIAEFRWVVIGGPLVAPLGWRCLMIVVRWRLV
jgi:hypothetical protein